MCKCYYIIYMRDLVNYLNYEQKLKLVEYYVNNNKINDEIV